MTRLIFDAPDAWPYGERTDKELTVEASTLTENYCTLKGHRFVRALLQFPKPNGGVFDIEAWASVSEATWGALMGARTGGAPFEGGFAWMANLVPGFGDEPQAMNLAPPAKPGGLPRLFAQDGLMAEAQKDGLNEDAFGVLFETASTED